MPKLPDQPNVIKCQVGYSIGTDNVVRTTVYFTYTGGPPTANDLNTIAAVGGSFCHQNFPPLLSPQVTWDGLSLTDLSTPTSAYGAYASQQAGTRTGAMLPASTALLCNYLINRRYRGGKPRSYLPWGTAPDLVSPQQWSSGFLSNASIEWNGFFNVMIGAVGGSTTIAAHVSISQYSGFKPDVDAVTGRTDDVPTVRTVAIAPDHVTGVQFNAKPASQRRRIAA